MQSIEFSEIYFWLPAICLRGIFVKPAFGLDPEVTPLYCSNTMQLQVSSFSFPARFLKRFIIIIAIVPFTIHLNAQSDTNYVDTISMNHIDTAVANNESTYNDQDEGYVDTTQKHIYDTSQYFFNWKTYYTDSFTQKKFAERNLINAEVAALKSDKDFWYIPAIEKMEHRLKTDPKYRDSLLKARNRKLEAGNQSNQDWLQTLILVIAILIFIAAIVYFLAQNKISIFSKESNLSGEENGDDEQQDIFHLSYTKLIQQAEKDKDYRVAIRLMFLQTLKLLSETNAIRYQPDYTDLHYLQQLHQSKYYDDFFKVMRSYEYAWYGKFDVSPQRYITIRNDFNKIQQKII